MDTQILSIFGYWQFTVCLFAFFALMAIWYHIGNRQKDFGQVWLALSILCWSFSGLVEIYFGSLDEVNVQSSYNLNGWRSIFSLFNSLFILLALPWFRYIPKIVEPIIKSTYWNIIVGLPFLFSLLPTVSKMITGGTSSIAELDVYYALLTLVFLGLVLWESFAKRRLTILAWLSVVCILTTLVAQVYKIIGSDIDLTLYSAIFKTSLIMIFFALALSWVKELSERIMPRVDDLYLKLWKSKNDKHRYEYKAQIGGISVDADPEIKLSSTAFDLLSKFGNARLHDDEGWLEIKAKGETRKSKTYDINDYNEIKRLMKAMLDGLFGEGAWSAVNHEQPLKAALFEMSKKRDRKIRLRIPKERIEIAD